MKSILVIPVMLFFSFGAQAQKKIQDFIGRWEIAGAQNAGASLEIIDSTTAIFTYQGETRKITDLKFDLSHSPYWLDFSAKDSNETMHVKSIFEPVGEGMMKWQLFVDEDRAPSFTSARGEILYLKKSRVVAATAANK